MYYTCINLDKSHVTRWDNMDANKYKFNPEGITEPSDAIKRRYG
jgi:hypothetical protein